MKLDEALSRIQPLDEGAMEQSRKHWSSLAKPLNSLGLLEKALVKIAGITGDPAIHLEKKAILVYCADNGVVAQGVSQSQQDVTAIVSENLTKCATSVCHMAKCAGADIIPVDVGVACDVDGPGMIHRKIAYGTRDFSQEPAMTREQAVEAIEVGINMVKDCREQGYHLLGTGEMGIGNTTTSSAIAAVLLHQSAEEVTGRGAGLSSAGLERKIQVINQAIRDLVPDENDPIDVLRKVGGFDIAALAGTFLGGAVYHVPVLVDGLISSVAALVAVRICPQVKDYILPSHASKEPAGQILMDALGLQPFLYGEMCLGEGTGTAAVMPILDMAAAVYHNMSSFEQVVIEAYQPLV